MTYKAVNDAIGPVGLLPTLLVYGAMPLPGVKLKQPHPTILSRAQAVQRATLKVSMHAARRQTRSALRSRHTSDATAAQMMVLRSLAIEFRERLHQWDEPFQVLYIGGDTITLLLLSPAGSSRFRYTVVRPYIPD